MRKYILFLKYAISSFTSFGLDILLFSIFSFWLKEIFPQSFIILSTIGARILSSLFNYIVNKHVVFKSNSHKTIAKYYLLSFCQMITSSLGVYVLYQWIGKGEIVIKIVVDIFLFLISFFIQRVWVFKNQRNVDVVMEND
ncbi:hypothetical protein GWK91_11305 [Virgibacillus sp. MSP4-1]|uniref:GtrA family protein n=1 Tax=Virgibacillus sp. MSP4-1 TaxID=2700081 RepID=UPI00069413C9|nr:GtrA family protein [Virgibacillus sp. MSP4-1]QHS23509.1 hypothetical protein GWK91_11305 [Virgibacillus sp. MSP4-1]